MNRPLFDPYRIFQTLNRRGVRYIVIGGIGAALRGSPGVTQDLDVCYARDRENLERLAVALEDLGAHVRGPGVPDDLPFRPDAETLEAGDHFTFATVAGDFDIMGTPAGTSGFRDLERGASEASFDGETVTVASIDDLIRMKMAAGRAKDLRDVELLRAMREEIGRQDG